jgi:hypothetical protein
MEVTFKAVCHYFQKSFSKFFFRNSVIGIKCYCVGPCPTESDMSLLFSHCAASPMFKAVSMSVVVPGNAENTKVKSVLYGGRVRDAWERHRAQNKRFVSWWVSDSGEGTQTSFSLQPNPFEVQWQLYVSLAFSVFNSAFTHKFWESFVWSS